MYLPYPNVEQEFCNPPIQSHRPSLGKLEASVCIRSPWPGKLPQGCGGGVGTVYLYRVVLHEDALYLILEPCLLGDEPAQQPQVPLGHHHRGAVGTMKHNHVIALQARLWYE